MSAVEKREILVLVAESGLPRRRALAHLRLSKSTYYRWLRRQTEGRLRDKKGGSLIPWNKLRPEEESKILLEAFGATLVIIPMPDIFMAMERGTVDAFHIGVAGIVDFSCVEVTNYMIDELHGNSPCAYLVNLEVWNSLPKHLQDAMTEAVIEQENEGAEAWENIIVGVKQEISAAGVEIVEFSPEEEKKFYDKYLESTWGYFMQRNPEVVAKFKPIVVP